MTQINRVTKMESGRTQASAEAAAAALQELNPREQKLLRDVLETYPFLSIEEAQEILREFGGL